LSGIKIYDYYFYSFFNGQGFLNNLFTGRDSMNWYNDSENGEKLQKYPLYSDQKIRKENR